MLAICAWMAMYQADAWAQFTVQHQAPTVVVKGQDTAFEFLVAGINQQQVQEALLFYRVDGDISFSQKEATLRNGIFSVRHRVDDNGASTFEYFFLLRLTNGQEVSFPEADFNENPIRVPIVGNDTDEAEYEQLTGVDYNILSPEEGTAFTEEDFVVAVALFYDQSTIEPGAFHLFVDGEDVTANADTSSHFISYAPEKIRIGNHTIALDYITNSGDRLRLIGWEFSIIDPSKAQYAGFGERRVPVGSLELTARNQDVGGDINDALTGRLRVSGSQGYFNYSVNGFLTSQESSRLQPQNRFGVNLNYGKWWRHNAGHIFPSISNLSLAGRRVFGVNSSIHLLNEGFNVQFLYGELNRDVSNIYGSLLRQEVFTEDGTAVVDTTYSLNFANEGRGTFTREIIGGRVAFGNPRKFQFGVHAIKVQDDTSSIDRITDFTSLQTFRRDLTSGLSAGDINKLTNQPELLAVNGNPTPSGNFVAGADLKFNADKRRIQFEGEVSAGVLNNDITGGALTVERADELGFDIDEDDADLLDRLSRFIIVNENLNNLPLRITDDDDTEFFFPTAILAGNGVTSLNYGANNLRVQYRWIGPDYNSLANNTVRRDVAGITITDRVRLFRNRIFLTLGYESLEDNVVGNLDATTTTDTYRSNISWYPVNRLLPRLSLGFRARTRDNDIARFNPNLGIGNLNASVQNFQIVNGDTLGAPTARSNSTFNFNGSITQQFELFGMLHDASVNLNTLQTTDDVFEFGDTKSTSVSLNVNSRFTLFPLNTNFGFTVNNTETISGLNEFNIFGFFVGGTYFLMDGKLRLTGRLAATNNKTTILPLRINTNGTDTAVDDFFEPDNPLSQRETEFSTFVLRTGLQYDINQYNALLFDANFTNVSGDNISNDRIVQLRYIFKF